MTISLQQATDVIWLQTSFLGDIILTTAAMGLLKKIRPDLRQHLITTGVGKAALKDHPALESIYVFNKSGLGLKSMKNVKADLRPILKSAIILQPHRSIRSSLLSRYLGCPWVTYQETALGIMADIRVPRVSVLHESSRIGLLLEPLGILREDILSAKPSLPVLETDLDTNSCLLQFSELLKRYPKIIALAPGSVWATKKWPLSSYKKLALMLIERYPNAALVLLGSAAETKDAEIIESHLGEFGQRILNLAGQTSLDDLRYIFPRLSGLVANDSSPLHYASAFNVPTVAVFGATVPEMGFTPLAEPSIVVENKNLSCRPCSDHGPKSCPLEHFRCMKEVSPNAVLEGCQQVINC